MKIKANAKINLTLNICGKRSDGYHLIDTVMISVGLFDEIILSKSDRICVVCDEIDNQKENIAYYAAIRFFEETGINGGCNIEIIKNIPISAGIGGGSADAAAVLCGLDKLYNTNLPYDKLSKIALTLGADVPFFIRGGVQRAEGIGEILTECSPLEKGYFLLAKTGNKTSTAHMYKLIDSKTPDFADTTAALESIKNNDLYKLSDNFKNAFESVNPPSDLKNILLAEKPIGVSLSGSGPTYFALFENKLDAHMAETNLKKQNIPCWVAAPCDKALIFE